MGVYTSQFFDNQEWQEIESRLTGLIAHKFEGCLGVRHATITDTLENHIFSFSNFLDFLEKHARESRLQLRIKRSAKFTADLPLGRIDEDIFFGSQNVTGLTINCPDYHGVQFYFNLDGTVEGSIGRRFIEKSDVCILSKLEAAFDKYKLESLNFPKPTCIKEDGYILFFSYVLEPEMLDDLIHYIDCLFREICHCAELDIRFEFRSLPQNHEPIEYLDGMCNKLDYYMAITNGWLTYDQSLDFMRSDNQPLAFPIGVTKSFLFHCVHENEGCRLAVEELDDSKSLKTFSKEILPNVEWTYFRGPMRGLMSDGRGFS